MRLPKTAHTTRPWRIHEIAPDFRVEDVWALPTPGGPDDLDRLVRQMAGGDEIENPVVRTLFAVRWRLGEVLGWDDSEEGVGERVPSLRDRLPEDLREAPGPDMRSYPFTSVYQTHDEWVAELANRTVHTLMHIGWVRGGEDGYRAQMTALVKPNGLLGEAYMAGIMPFRYVLVYPRVLETIGRRWRTPDAT
nr:NftR1 [Streptomyces conglobatus]